MSKHFRITDSNDTRRDPHAQSRSMPRTLDRRAFLQGGTAVLVAGLLESIAPTYALGAGRRVGKDTIDGLTQTDLRIARHRLPFAGRDGNAIGLNGSVPGPLVRLREGQKATLRVTNALDVDSSIHWHGLLVPADMDGVPGVSFAGIRPNSTFTYKYEVRQNGTYWYHSHSGLQEQSGVYGPLIIDPAEPDPFAYEREYVVLLSDWTFEDPHRVLSNIKTIGSYYNYQRRTLIDFAREISAGQWRDAISSRLAWGRMRMDPTDFADVTGATYTYLMNGLAPESNWTALFRPGERVRLRFINGSAMTYFDVRVPGLPLTVVQADGQNVKPVEVDEFRIAVAETYDVIVTPTEDRAFTVFAESMDRGGYARGTLAPRSGMTAPIPARRTRPLRTMADMGMADMGMADMKDRPGMDAMGADSAIAHQATPSATPKPDKGHAGHDTVASTTMPRGSSKGSAGHGAHMAAPTAETASPPGSAPMPEMTMDGPARGSSPGGVVPHGPDTHGLESAMVAMAPSDRLSEPGNGLGDDGWRVLVYRDLEADAPFYDEREPEREIELHLTGNMERYMWSFDGEKFTEVTQPIAFHEGERLRLVLVNDTMMEHPIHLHGMWMELENDARLLPRKHTLNVKPGERLSVRVSADARGNWAFHCHLLYHMEMGMFRIVRVS